ncbi:MAG: dinitrogenase iron-molybdenum cofactor biosynthesis protein [Oscillospiraceae bacterium]|jgi:predicted Fe-Mo cluster-binding NifX family protein|nr:dinitrogenase iron-molybdenum cofactor biosynthesis protein [Oscillospiraceae bacterium]
MVRRIALVSTDGKVINQHFGRAVHFNIVDICDQSYEVIEQRDTAPVCSGYAHDDDALAHTVQKLSDCSAVFAAKIGQGAVNALQAAGIRAFEAPGAVEDILVQIIAEHVLDD